MAIKLTPQLLVHTAYRSFRHAMLLPVTPPTPDDLVRWERVARGCEGVFVSMQRAKYHEVGLALRGLYADAPEPGAPAPPVPRGEALAFEAVARHLMALLDSDEVTAEDVPMLEETWRRWADQRTIKLGSR